MNLQRLAPTTRPARLERALRCPPLYVKRDDMTGFALGGNKVRKLEYLAADALAKGCDTLVSIGIPVRNAGDGLVPVVESRLAQDHPHLELVISDNASTDDSVSVALMHQLNLSAIATADADFTTVSGVHVYQPGDIS